MEIDSIVVDDGLSLAVRRSRRQNRQLPPTGVLDIPSHLQLPSPSSIGPQNQLKLLKSPTNAFGLFRQYKAASFPSHDPEVEGDAIDLSDILSDHRERDSGVPIYLPYPNENAFLLGEWFWDDHVQKSQESFKKLVNIVGRPEFKPEDVRDVSWDSINRELGDSSQLEEWLDEPDAGWTQTMVTISVPFHRNTNDPGVRQYGVPLYHRSIVAILKEKMANSDDFRYFHFTPFELRHQRGDGPRLSSVRVYGELYTSPVFIEAYNEVQTSPGEAACLLQRVVVGLMFGSDSTQLTQFGNSSLWPCYLYFGNESKYRRREPSSNLCNHVAYFQKVGYLLPWSNLSYSDL
jgi:Plavaka transposase